MTFVSSEHLAVQKQAEEHTTETQTEVFAIQINIFKTKVFKLLWAAIL